MPATLSADVFNAIAHPVRRSLLDTLAAGDQPVNRLAEQYHVSRPAISQHLRILLDAGLVESRPEGRTNRYSLKPDRLIHVYDWLGKYERFWQERFVRLGQYLSETAARDAETSAKRPTQRRKP
jgi:DNA-binding transcriptional ArsR family regulator